MEQKEKLFEAYACIHKIMTFPQKTFEEVKELIRSTILDTSYASYPTHSGRVASKNSINSAGIWQTKPDR